MRVSLFLYELILIKEGGFEMKSKENSLVRNEGFNILR